MKLETSNDQSGEIYIVKARCKSELVVKLGLNQKIISQHVVVEGVYGPLLNRPVGDTVLFLARDAWRLIVWQNTTDCQNTALRQNTLGCRRDFAQTTAAVRFGCERHTDQNTVCVFRWLSGQSCFACFRCWRG